MWKCGTQKTLNLHSNYFNFNFYELTGGTTPQYTQLFTPLKKLMYSIVFQSAQRLILYTLKIAEPNKSRGKKTLFALKYLTHALI